LIAIMDLSTWKGSGLSRRPPRPSLWPLAGCCIPLIACPPPGLLSILAISYCPLCISKLVPDSVLHFLCHVYVFPAHPIHRFNHLQSHKSFLPTIYHFLNQVPSLTSLGACPFKQVCMRTVQDGQTKTWIQSHQRRELGAAL
jgi:hypothetical protein